MNENIKNLSNNVVLSERHLNDLLETLLVAVPLQDWSKQEVSVNKNGSFHYRKLQLFAPNGEVVLRVETSSYISSLFNAGDDPEVKLKVSICFKSEDKNGEFFYPALGYGEYTSKACEKSAVLSAIKDLVESNATDAFYEKGRGALKTEVLALLKK